MLTRALPSSLNHSSILRRRVSPSSRLFDPRRMTGPPAPATRTSPGPVASYALAVSGFGSLIMINRPAFWRFGDVFRGRSIKHKQSKVDYLRI
jgi:hypothetical protein